MTRRSMMIAIITMFVATAPLAAHDDYRIIGTVTKFSAKEIFVKQMKTGKVIGMDIDGATIVTRDKKKVARTELQVGANVVVDARGDSIDELLVLEIKLMPAPTRK